jgi:hypothetical protein
MPQFGHYRHFGNKVVERFCIGHCFKQLLHGHINAAQFGLAGFSNVSSRALNRGVVKTLTVYTAPNEPLPISLPYVISVGSMRQLLSLLFSLVNSSPASGLCDLKRTVNNESGEIERAQISRV